MTVKSEEDLIKLVNGGCRVHYDRRYDRYKLYDPETGKYSSVDRSLNPLCKKFYEGQKKRGRGEAEAGRGMEEIAEDDVKFLLSTIKQKLDPKAPIITKWTENVSWWTHVFLDFSALTSPYILSLLTPSEIDLSNPEATVKNMVGKFEVLRKKAARADEIEAKYKGEVEHLRQALREYKEIIDEQNKLLAEVIDKFKKTINFFLIVLPKRLPEELRGTYRVYLPKLKEVLGV